jgi:uncharacterized protein
MGSYQLGLMYEKGLGVPKNPELAAKHFAKAFEVYTDRSRYRNYLAYKGLADCYRYGRGTDVDFKKAFEFYMKAAELNSIEAMHGVAELYKTGQVWRRI